jgi:hypothetical protein
MATAASNTAFSISFEIMVLSVQEARHSTRLAGF